MQFWTHDSLEKCTFYELDWPNHFELVFTYFQRSIQNFSITEHCFGDQIVNFSPIVVIFGVQAPI